MSDITVGWIERMSDGPTMADLIGVRAVSSEVPALRKRISDLESQVARLTAEKQAAERERDEWQAKHAETFAFYEDLRAQLAEARKHIGDIATALLGRDPSERGWTYVPGTLADEVRAMRTRIAEEQASFDLRWKADMRAIKQWQEAHPGNDLVWPGCTDLCVWLMEQLAEARKAASQ